MRVRYAATFLILFLTISSVAQDKRTEFSALPKALDSLKVNYNNKLLTFPLVALSTETSWVFGIASAYIFKTYKKDPNLRTSWLAPGFLYTLNDQILIGLGANIFLPREKYIIRFENTFSKFPDKFWGLGNSTPENAKEAYTFTQFYINPAISRKVQKNLFLGAGFELQNVFDIKYDSGGSFEKYQVVGIYNRTSYFVFGYSALITYDSRNHAFTPNHGSLLRMKFSNFNKNLASDYNFHSIDFDFRKFIELKPQKVLAFQGYGLFAFGDVPYRNLASLGGNTMMRGYYGGRYRDKMFIGAQAEYRFPIYWRFGAVTFASAGQVADHASQFNFSQFHYAAGAGIRFLVLPKEKLNLRFDVAYGNMVNYYIALFESF